PAHADALAQLAQTALVELAVELGLTQQQDLDQLLAARLEIREQAHLLERVLRERLRLVDDQEDAPAPLLLLEQEPVELAHQVAAAQTFGGQTELGADRLQQLDGAAARIEEEGDLELALEPLEQRPTEGGLARADLAGHGDEALALLDAVEQVGQGFAVGRREIEEARVRAQREGLLSQDRK